MASVMPWFCRVRKKNQFPLSTVFDLLLLKEEILYLLPRLGKYWLTVSCKRLGGSRVYPNFDILMTFVTIQRTLEHSQFLQPSFVSD